MHNIKDIRKDFMVLKVIKKRYIRLDFENLYKLDEKIENLYKKKKILKKKKKKFQNLKIKLYLKNQKKFLDRKI